MKNRKKRTRLKKQTAAWKTKLRVALYVGLVASIVVLGSTYAWFSSADAKKNHFAGKRLAAEIVEVFEENASWEAGKKTVKIVRAQNIGEVPAFIRLSFYEYLITFQVDVIDQTGNGHLKQAAAATKPAVDGQEPTNWSKDAAAGRTYTVDGKHYLAAEAYPADTAHPQRYDYTNSVLRDNTPLKYWTLNFNQAKIYTAPPPAGTKNYWLYKDGYFYYSELTNPGDQTERLLESVTLSRSFPNRYKGSLYQLNPKMEAHDATSVLTSEWGIGTSGIVYDMYKDKLKK